MATIIRGTTPTIKYTFDQIDVADLTAAVLTVSQESTVVIEKDLAAGTAADDYLAWTLAQAETLELDADHPAKIRCNWKLSDGTRGASRVTIASVEDNDKSEVI